MDKIAIVGAAQTRFEARKKDETCYDLVYQVTTAALQDAGYSLDDIDNVVTVSNDFYDGRTISSMAVGEAAGAHDKNISTVEGDGTFGAFYGAMRVLGGYRSTLVVAHSKGSEGDPRFISNAMFDPVYHRPLGLDAVSAAALQANAYLDRYGLSEEQCALVPVKNHGNARHNPNAHQPLDLSVDDVLRSPRIAGPLKALDCSPVSDGAAAIILANETLAAKARSQPVWVRGVAHCAEAYFLGDRDPRAGAGLAIPKALGDAARRAYRMAGIHKPLAEIDVVELYDAFGYMEPLWLEGLGFCEPGHGARLTEQGTTALDGALPVNPSGGVLSAHAVLVAGLVRIVEAVLQLRGQAGARQVDGARTALAHGLNGPLRAEPLRLGIRR